MPDVMQQVNELKSLPDQALQFELANPSGAVPAYLVLAEAQRRQLLRSAAQAQQNQAPVGSVYDDVIRSMMARQPQPGQAPAGMTPPPASPPSQPQNMRSPLQMAEGGDVDEDDDGGGDDGGGDGGVTELPTKFNLNAAIRDTALRHNRNPAELYGIVKAESGGDPNAVSPKGAIGLGQLMPATARRFGVDDPTDPEQNLEGTATYLDYLDRKFNKNPTLVHAAYNAGEGAVDKYGGVPPFKETKNYVNRVNQFAKQFTGAETWRPQFVEPPETRLAPPDLPGPGPDRASADIAAVKAMQSLVPQPGDDTSGLASAEPPNVGAPGPSTPQMPDALSGVLPPIAPPGAPAAAAAAPVSYGPPAPISVPAVTAAAPSEAAADIKELRGRLQKLWDEAESSKHPTVKQALFRMLENFGAGMATTPARNWGGALAGGAAGIAKGWAADQEAARQQELKLLGVSLDTDKMLQEHEDAAARIRATAQNEAYKSHDETYAKAPGVILGKPGDPSPGPGYVPEPSLLNPGQIYWYSGTGLVTPENQQFLPGKPPVGSMLPRPVVDKANDSWRKSQETLAAHLPTSPAEILMNPTRFTPAQVTAAQTVMDQEHPDKAERLPTSPAQILMNKDKFTPAQVTAAQTLWDKEHPGTAQQDVVTKQMAVINAQRALEGKPPAKTWTDLTPEEQRGINAVATPVAETREDKEAAQQKSLGLKLFEPAMASAERFNIMAENYENAVKNHDQQAMLSLLYNHMGMTMGMQKGARMSQQLIQEAIKSQPWLQGLMAKFDKDGYLTGVTLSKQQMQQMVNLAQSRFAQDVQGSRNRGLYSGLKDDGPARTPNQAIVNRYLFAAGRDPVKAKQMMAADGWSVQ